MANVMRVFSVHDFERMINNANSCVEIKNVIVIVLGQFSAKKLSKYAFAGLLSKASEKIYSFK